MDALCKLDGSDSVGIIYDVKQTKQWYLPYNFYVPMGSSFFSLRAYLTFPYVHQHDLSIQQ